LSGRQATARAYEHLGASPEQAPRAPETRMELDEDA
jgi:hypothetical protein